MNFGQLQDLTLVWLDDLDAGYFTRPQIKRWLNNALHECQKQLIQAESSWYMRCVQTNTIANKDSYALPSDFLKLNRLEIYTQGSGTLPSDLSTLITPVTPVEAMSAPLGPGLSTIYYLKKDCIVLRPYPDRAYPLKLTYSYAASEMTNDNETPDVPIQFQEYLSILAARDGFLRDQRDFSGFANKIAYYETLMRQDANQRNIDAPRTIVRTEDDGFDISL